MDDKIRFTEFDILKSQLQNIVKILYVKTSGSMIYDKNVDIGKLIEEFAPLSEKEKGIPIGEVYRLFDFIKLEDYYKEVHKNNEKNLKEQLELLKTYENAYENLKETCKAINAEISEEKDKYSTVLKTNLRIIKTSDVQVLRESIEKIIQENKEKINTELIDKLLIELKSNLKRRIYIYLSRFKIEESSDVSKRIKDIMDSITTGKLLKESIKVDMDLIMDISEEFLKNSEYRTILLNFLENPELNLKIKKLLLDE